MDKQIERREMVTRQLRERDIRDERVLHAMEQIPRHEFVPNAFQGAAYNDRPLSIGGGQTISQPYIVALMTQFLTLSATDRVLEIGTGSGYQTAILASLAKEVVSVERLPELTERARVVLSRLGFENVTLHVGDGSKGWPEQGPYDAILVTAGAPTIPEALLEQLAEGGRLVCPVGSRKSQRLIQIVRRADGFFEEEKTPCVFVPLIGEEGWPE